MNSIKTITTFASILVFSLNVADTRAQESVVSQVNGQPAPGLKWVSNGGRPMQAPRDAIGYGGGTFAIHPSGDLGSRSARFLVIRSRLNNGQYHLGFAMAVKYAGGAYGDTGRGDAEYAPVRQGHVFAGQNITPVTQFEFLTGKDYRWINYNEVNRVSARLAGVPLRGVAGNEGGSLFVLARQQSAFAFKVGFFTSSPLEGRTVKREAFFAEGKAWVLGRGDKALKAGPSDTATRGALPEFPGSFDVLVAIPR